MLKSVTVGNFRAFSEKNPVTIDFSATGKYDYNTDCIKDGVVKTAIMYGKNASGKSSLAYAIFDIVSNLTDKYVDARNYRNYRNALTPDAPTTFTFVFVLRDVEVKYSYRKTSLKTFVSETLSIGNKPVIDYDRSVSSGDFEVNLEGAETLQKDLRNLEISALKWVKNNTSLVDTETNRVFADLFAFVNRMLLFWSLENRSFIGYSATSNGDIVDEIIENGQFDELKQFFIEAGFEDELTHSNKSGKEELYLRFGEIDVEFSSARSTGMSSLLLVFYWLSSLKDKAKAPSFICIDEFDAFYHFELSRFVIRRLKQRDCQVLLTTHNTALFSNDILRPDCYYICAKDRIVNAHNATPKELRQGHNLEKLYRGGTFGL